MEGDFESGDVIEVVDAHGTVHARGVTGYSAEELPQMMGRSTAELADKLGPDYERAVVHTDDMARVRSV